MDDLKIQQALGAVEGPLRALVAEAEGQGRIAGAAAEAERIWQVGKALAKEWDWPTMGNAVTFTAFLTELRTRAVPGEAGTPELLAAREGQAGVFRGAPPFDLPPADDAHVAVGSVRFSDGQVQTEESLARAAVGLPQAPSWDSNPERLHGQAHDANLQGKLAAHAEQLREEQATAKGPASHRKKS